MPDENEAPKESKPGMSGAAYRMNEAQWLRESRTGGRRIEMGGREYLKMKEQQEARVYAVMKLIGALFVCGLLYFLLRR